MIELKQLTKRYANRNVVDGLSFTVHPGEVTGFLGPNGAGKSTTMRSLVGLDRPSSGLARINGKQYAHMTTPLCEVGALLDARSAHPRLRAVDHLRSLAVTHGLPRSRVDEVLNLVGLGDAGRRRIGAFSLGMRQRLGIAAALLGDPATIILDEPVNGLDPEGIIWIRELLSSLAEEGRTVFLSSHLMTEMAMIAQRVIVIGEGRLIKDTTVEDLTQSAEVTAVSLRALDPAGMEQALNAAEIDYRRTGDVLRAEGVSPEAAGRVALKAGIVLTELIPHRVSLETAVLDLTASQRTQPELMSKEAAQ